jgi:hypothetical protein
VSVLLAPDAVQLYPADGADAYGWALPDEAALAWSGQGSLQLAPGLSDPRAADRGGHGPYDPAAADRGALFLPPEANPAEGCSAVIRGRRYVLSQVRLVPDPTDPAGGASCWAATVTGTTAWPGAT